MLNPSVSGKRVSNSLSYLVTLSVSKLKTERIQTHQSCKIQKELPVKNIECLNLSMLNIDHCNITEINIS